MFCKIWIIGLIILELLTSFVHSHGYLWSPPGRSTAWRAGFASARNYGDMSLFCGGFNTQWKQNGGKCGVCGDNYNDKIKDNEDLEGKYVKNRQIVATYTQGEVIETVARLTAFHKGKFRFRLCALPYFDKKVTEECLAQNVLRESGTGQEWIDTTTMITGTDKEYITYIQLPENVTCEFCVLQWWWHTGNKWNCDKKEICCGGGCGPQETFVNCADIRIVSKDGSTSNNDGDIAVNDNTGSDTSDTESDDSWDAGYDIWNTGDSNDNDDSLEPVDEGAWYVYSTEKYNVETTTARPTKPPTTKAPKRKNNKKNKKKNKKGKKKNDKAKNKKNKKNKKKKKPKNNKSGNAVSRPTSKENGCSKTYILSCANSRLYTRCSSLKGLNYSNWCCQNCNHTPSFCPPSHCCCEN
ncbi:hypothetical protein ACF0H5_019734 [Mactra antiquata]